MLAEDRNPKDNSIKEKQKDLFDAYQIIREMGREKREV